MYSPVRDGMLKAVQSVRYAEVKPPDELSRLVHSFWELKTEGPLFENFHLHALPDACVNILFNQLDIRIAGVTALRITYEVLDLGRSFHYAGIQLLPGVWQGNRDEILDRFVGTPYQGDLPLVQTSRELSMVGFAAKSQIMTQLVCRLVAAKIIVANAVTEKILAHLDDINSVADMATLAGMSPRQLQRTLLRTTGFAPHDFLKVLRLQHSVRLNNAASYADQSHYIHSFRRIFGYTPARFAEKFDV